MWEVGMLQAGPSWPRNCTFVNFEQFQCQNHISTPIHVQPEIMQKKWGWKPTLWQTNIAMECTGKSWRFITYWKWGFSIAMLVDWSVTQPPKKILEWIEVGRNGTLPQVFGQCPATQPCDEYLKFWHAGFLGKDGTTMPWNQHGTCHMMMSMSYLLSTSMIQLCNWTILTFCYPKCALFYINLPFQWRMPPLFRWKWQDHLEFSTEPQELGTWRKHQNPLCW